MPFLRLDTGYFTDISRIAAVTVATCALFAGSARAQSADDGLAARVEQLEQQLVEMQVTVGTLESLARGRPAGGANYQAAASSASGADVSQMEIQIRALSGQVATLSREVRSLQGSRVSNAGAITNNSFAQPLDTTPASTGTAIDGFGSVTVTNEQGQSGRRQSVLEDTITRDPIGNILSNDQANVAASNGTQVAATSAIPSRAAYDKAYGYLLEQDYGAAEVAFGDFVTRHPKDKLAGNAQYWLGESHYVRGNYRAAANAFLKGYKTYGKGAKAPDSLLKLAMSLSRLGQKPSACATFQELESRFPNAPVHVTRRSKAERQRAGC